MKKTIFLDRDGVINKAIVLNGKPYPPPNLDDVKICKGVRESMDLLKASNWMIIVVTNQPDVARGITSRFKVEKINSYLKQRLPIDEIYTCYHDDNDNCECRKPKPGFLKLAAKNNIINLSESYMIGDRWSDIEAGEIAGCKTFFIDNDYNEKKPLNFTFRVKSLKEATDIILGRRHGKN